MKKNKSEKNSANMKIQKKYILLIGLGFVFLFVVLLSTKFNPMRLLGSAYNTSEIENNINKIKIGDKINYEINGYSDWQVVSIDKNNNTLDVVSKTNVEDISLTTKEDYENALNIFQETANKYTDNSYAIKARCVTRADLDNFGFDEVFWNADIYDGAVAFTNGAVRYGATENLESVYNFLPYVMYHFEQDISGYNYGDEIEISIGGIDKWIFIQQPYNWKETNMIVPATPININIIDDEFVNNPDKYFKDFYQMLKDADPNVGEVGNFLYYYGYNAFIDDGSVKEYYSSKANKYRFIGQVPSINYYGNYLEIGFNNYDIDYENNNADSNWISYRKAIPFTKGFRPIVTLKYSDKLIEGKKLDSELQIGDYVNYSANEYNNWRVLSIDEENGTVDIISGGVVKNIKLYGIDDFNNYETTMQNEVDSYKNGDKAISARIVEYNDLANLNKMNDRVNVKYWTFETKDYNKKATNDTSSPFATNAYYDASIMYYDINESMIQRKWVSLYVSSGLSSGGNTILSQYNGTGDLSFTAGIRPVITLKLDQVKKVSDDEKNNIINDSDEQQKIKEKEQITNSQNNVTNDNTKNVTNNYSNIINNKKNNVDNNKSNNELNDDDNSESINNYYRGTSTKGKSNKIIKYIVIALVVLNIAILGQVVLSAFIIKNIKNIKRRKK